MEQDSHGELLAKMEAATEGSREMDCALALAIGGFVIYGESYGEPAYCYRSADGDFHRPGQGADMLVPRYTTSIDAAMKLVPEGWDASVCFDGASAPAGKRGGAVVRNPGRKDEPTFTSWKRATPPLALCTAALRARSSDKESAR